MTITIDGVDRSGVIDRRHVDLAESAYLGEVAEGAVILNDVAGNISIKAHRPVTVDDGSQRVFTGYTRSKKIGRAVNPSETHPMGASRAIKLAIVDLNSLLRRKIIRRYAGMTKAEGGVRPAESAADRLTWLLAGPWLAGLVSDFGAVTYPDGVGLDAARLMGQYPGDVLAQIAKACRFSGVYVRYNAAEDAAELVFRDDNESTADTATVSISNAGDADGSTIFAPNEDAELDEDGEHVYSGMLAAYRRGYVFEDRPATAAAYADRDGTTEDTGMRNAATARRDAITALWESRSEEQSLPVKLRIRNAQLALFPAGHRISTRMIHMAPEGWEPARYARILRRRFSLPLGTDDAFDLQLDLSPQESGPPAGTIVQSAFGRGGPGALTLTLPNAVTVDDGSGTHVLVAIVAERDNGMPYEPSDDGGPWTRLNGSLETSAEHGATASGIAAYWKVTDSTDRTIGFHDYACFGVWELDGVDMSGATVVAVDDQTTSASPAVMNIGSLGSPATGEVILMGHVIVNNADGSGFGDYRPIIASTPSAGWAQRFWNGPVDFSFGVWPAVYYPLVSFCDGLGDGSAVTAQLSRPSGLASPPGGTSTPTAWAGIAIKIPAAA